jgi:hypothetical protein
MKNSTLQFEAAFFKEKEISASGLVRVEFGTREVFWGSTNVPTLELARIQAKEFFAFSDNRRYSAGGQWNYPSELGIRVYPTHFEMIETVENRTLRDLLNDSTLRREDGALTDAAWHTAKRAEESYLRGREEPLEDWELDLVILSQVSAPMGWHEV